MLVMGRGPDEARLRRLTAKLGLDDAVEFRGFLPWDELVRTLHRAHVFLNPSPKEGWGLTVIEANQCGLPVVASDRPGLRDSVQDGETGALVPYGDDGGHGRGRPWRLLRDRDPVAGPQRRGPRAGPRTFSWERCVERVPGPVRRGGRRGRRGAA